MATKTKPRKSTKLKRLPEKLSDCLAVALRDLIKVERMKRTYRVDMSVFHQPEPNGKCTVVCLSGCVMAQTLRANRKRNLWPDNFDTHTDKRLRAISNCAIGSARVALYSFHALDEYEKFPHALPPAYDDSPTKFKACIREQIKLLRKHGL